MLYNIFSGGSSYEIFLVSAYTEREAGCIVTQKGTISNSIPTMIYIWGNRYKNTSKKYILNYTQTHALVTLEN